MLKLIKRYTIECDISNLKDKNESVDICIF